MARKAFKKKNLHIYVYVILHYCIYMYYFSHMRYDSISTKYVNQ